MENENRDNLQLHGLKEKLTWNEKNIFGYFKPLCKSLSGISQKACWIDLGEMFAEISKTPNQVANYCKDAPAKDIFIRCFARGVAFFSVLQKIQKIPFDTSSSCNPVENTPYIGLCIQQVVAYLVNYDPKLAGSEILKYCQKLKDMSGFCYKALVNQLTVDNKFEEIQTICKTLPNIYRKQCNIRKV